MFAAFANAPKNSPTKLWKDLILQKLWDDLSNFAYPLSSGRFKSGIKIVQGRIVKNKVFSRIFGKVGFFPIC